MTPEQIQMLIDAINKLVAASTRQYTITGAADWPLVTVLGGAIVGLVVFMWIDLRSTIKEGRNEWKSELDKEVGLLWSETRKIRQEQKECKEKCLGK